MEKEIKLTFIPEKYTSQLSSDTLDFKEEVLKELTKTLENPRDFNSIEIIIKFN